MKYRQRAIRIRVDPHGGLHIMELVLVGRNLQVLPIDLPPEIIGAPVMPSSSVWIPLPNRDEKSRFLAALSDAKGNRTEAARRLGVSRATFYRRLVELDIDPR
jgi:transcriptional regulator of acetoin/glycerol metabolism